MSDPFEGTPFIQAECENKEAAFTLPENSVDLIDLFLDPDIQAARAEAERSIENNAAMTPAAKAMSKAILGVQAMVKQSQRAQAGNTINGTLSQDQSREIRQRTRRQIRNRR